MVHLVRSERPQAFKLGHAVGCLRATESGMIECSMSWRVATVMTTVALMAFSTHQAGAVNALGFLVPAYFYPSGAGNGFWESLNSTATRVPLVAILNPNSGTGSSVDSNFRRVTTAL